MVSMDEWGVKEEYGSCGLEGSGFYEFVGG